MSHNIKFRSRSGKWK